MKKFLLINPFGIGDVLFTTPVIRAIREAYPDAYIGYWSNLRLEPLLKDNPAINRVFALSRGDLKKIFRQSWPLGIGSLCKLLSGIKKEKFDLCLDFSLDHRYGLAARLLGIKRRIGFDYKGRGRFLTDKLKIEGYDSKPVAEYYRELLRPLNLDAPEYNLELFVSESDKISCRKMLDAAGADKNKPLVGLAPAGGASWGRDAARKYWPQENYARLADRIIDELGLAVVLLGDAGEKGIAEKVINKMHNRVIDLVGKTDLKGLAALIANLEILAANDGGPLHMAAALGKKTLSFFGPVDPKVYGPYPADGKKHIVLKKELECSPCYLKFRLSPCSRNSQCLRDIGVDSAFEALKRLL